MEKKIESLQTFHEGCENLADTVLCRENFLPLYGVLKYQDDQYLLRYLENYIYLSICMF